MKHKLFVLLAAFTFIGASGWGSGGTGDTATTGSVGGGMYSQSPFLDARVASGELPPVDERLPVNPLVVTPLDEIGTYGGRITVFSGDPNPWGILVGENPEGAPPPIKLGLDLSFSPGLAEEWEDSADFKTFTLKLREGAKFSNGDPFTAEDWRFKFHDMEEKDLGYVWGAPSQLESVTVVDEYTVRFDFSEPFPKAINYFSDYHMGSDWGGYAPSTWLKQWHAEYNDDAQAKAQEEGFDTWQDAFNDHSLFCCPQKDPERPTMFPFMLVDVTQTYKAKERNPYYVAVDTIGQQLPYVDTALIQWVDGETRLLKIIAGEADFGIRPLADYPVLLDAQDSGNFTINLQKAGWEGTGNAWMFNLNHIDPVKREIFQNIDFRRAMSLSLDRDRMNDVAWLGQADPVAVATLFSGASIFKDEWGKDHPYNRYDPAEAGRLLDSIGLDEMNSDGIRLMSDGRPLVIVYSMRAGKPTPVNELLKEDFEAVGVGLELRTSSPENADTGARQGTLDFAGVNEVHSELGSYGSGTGGINQWVDFMMYQWSRWWWDERGTGGGPPSEGPDYQQPEEPPQIVKDYMDAQIIKSKSYSFGSAEQKRYSTEAWQIVADQMWQLGALQGAPLTINVRTNLMNVPQDVGAFGDSNAAFAIFADQYFFKN
jgi:peptide/nickel transport system substrate-binding protein